jgi:hypothetical protein
LVIDKNGVVVWNVLSEESNILKPPELSYLSVKEIGDSQLGQNARVSLKKDGDKISLVVSSESGDKQLDVSDWKDDVVEIEERPEVQMLKIGVRQSKFTLEQGSFVAVTDFPVSVDSKTAKISVLTSSGDRYLSILPSQAAESVLRAKIVSNVSNLEITEDGQELQYLVSGNKVLNFFNVFEYSIPIKSHVSASTGEILGLEAPKWYRFVGFLFT